MFKRKTRILKTIFITGLLSILSLTAYSYADIYYYVDENGVLYFTNIPSDSRYKNIISEDGAIIKRKVRISPDYNQIINNISRKYKVEASLVKAVIKVESNWDNTAVSKKGAIGLMQLMPSTVKAMNVKDPFNPAENIEGGTRYLRHLLDKFKGDLNLTLAAYNAGPETIGKFKGIPPIPETQQYVKEVLSVYNNTSGRTSTAIYRIIYSDGSILYTNTPFIYERFMPSEF